MEYKVRKKLMALLLFTLMLASCSTQEHEVSSIDGPVRLLVQVEDMVSSTTTRAQTAPSINTDAEREDYVGKLALLVYESGALGKQVVAQFAVAPNVSQLHMQLPKGGSYDFYFIANYPDVDATLQAMDKATLTTYLTTLKPYAATDYRGVAGNATVVYPMSRVYLNQNIAQGDGLEKAFVPTLTDPQLAPVSKYGTEFNKEMNPQKVRLIRSVAKMQLNLSGAGLAEVASVKYINAATQTSFAQLGQTDAQPGVTNLDVTLADAGTTKTAQLYIPERIAAPSDLWSVGDKPMGNVNYIEVLMVSGVTYRVPVISNPTLGTNRYMDLAKGKVPGETPDYSVVRNKSYVFNIAVPQDSKELAVSLQVMPWDYAPSEFSYQFPIYTVQVFDSKGVLQTDIKKDIELIDVAAATIKFTISEPQGQRWTASITNNMDFMLTIVDDATGTILTDGDIVGATSKTYTMTLKPRIPFESAPKYTKFLIALESKELYLGSEVRYVRDGEAGEWGFKQIMP